MGGRRAEDVAWPLVVEEQIKSMRAEMSSRFDSMSELFNQRIRHGDATINTTMNMLADTVHKIQQSQQEHELWAQGRLKEIETRFRTIEDQQLTWRSNMKLIGGMIGGSGAAGTALGFVLGGNHL